MQHGSFCLNMCRHSFVYFLLPSTLARALYLLPSTHQKRSTMLVLAPFRWFSMTWTAAWNERSTTRRTPLAGSSRRRRSIPRGTRWCWATTTASTFSRTTIGRKGDEPEESQVLECFHDSGRTPNFTPTNYNQRAPPIVDLVAVGSR